MQNSDSKNLATYLLLTHLPLHTSTYPRQQNMNKTHNLHIYILLSCYPCTAHTVTASCQSLPPTGLQDNISITDEQVEFVMEETKVHCQTQDISVFDNIAEILPRLPDSENGPAPVATEHFLCGYRYADGPRSLMFSLEELVGIRCCYLEMSREELDIAILSCGMHMSKITSHGRYSEEDAEN
ncbi:hypothetical protein NP493_1878g00022 [Ridgeia piscesae]|uniref:Uncharacterized protein n=1 Tax=Ridgeia piscesae TaxID=27915 RepID=A0AAD9JSK4_RIDPI|nr:hypothetical protein NP493_1878g00022 [Ridgeia piscesae]